MHNQKNSGYWYWLRNRTLAPRRSVWDFCAFSSMLLELEVISPYPTCLFSFFMSIYYRNRSWCDDPRAQWWIRELLLWLPCKTILWRVSKGHTEMKAAPLKLEVKRDQRICCVSVEFCFRLVLTRVVKRPSVRVGTVTPITPLLKTTERRVIFTLWLDVYLPVRERGLFTVCKIDSEHLCVCSEKCF